MNNKIKTKKIRKTKQYIFNFLLQLSKFITNNIDDILLISPQLTGILRNKFSYNFHNYILNSKTYIKKAKKQEIKETLIKTGKTLVKLNKIYNSFMTETKQLQAIQIVIEVDNKIITKVFSGNIDLGYYHFEYTLIDIIPIFIDTPTKTKTKIKNNKEYRFNYLCEYQNKINNILNTTIEILPHNYYLNLFKNFYDNKHYNKSYLNTHSKTMITKKLILVAKQYNAINKLIKDIKKIGVDKVEGLRITRNIDNKITHCIITNKDMSKKNNYTTWYITNIELIKDKKITELKDKQTTLLNKVLNLRVLNDKYKNHSKTLKQLNVYFDNNITDNKEIDNLMILIDNRLKIVKYLDSIKVEVSGIKVKYDRGIQERIILNNGYTNIKTDFKFDNITNITAIKKDSKEMFNNLIYLVNEYKEKDIENNISKIVKHFFSTHLSNYIKLCMQLDKQYTIKILKQLKTEYKENKTIDLHDDITYLTILDKAKRQVTLSETKEEYNKLITNKYQSIKIENNVELAKNLITYITNLKEIPCHTFDNSNYNYTVYFFYNKESIKQLYKKFMNNQIQVTELKEKSNFSNREIEYLIKYRKTLNKSNINYINIKYINGLQFKQYNTNIASYNKINVITFDVYYNNTKVEKKSLSFKDFKIKFPAFHDKLKQKYINHSWYKDTYSMSSELYI